MKKILVLVAVICYSVSSNAQSNAFGYYQDALLFGQSNYALGSSARMQAIGGAQFSLGGDISSAVSNPAGLGFFNKNVFVVSPSLNFSNLSTDFGIVGDQSGAISTEESFKNNFNIANIGTVLNFNKGRFTEDKFKGGSLAITLSRANSFNLERSYEGANDFNSLADALAINAGTLDPNDLGELAFAAYDQYLISPIYDANDNITNYIADFDGYPIQSEMIKEKGSQYQLNIAWGGNYDDRLYFGGGMGVQVLNYQQQRTYREDEFVVFDNQGNGTPDSRLNGFVVNDELSIRGMGMNFNFGVIARPVDFLTVGASYTSPSFMSLDEESFVDLDANWKAGATSGTDVIDDINPYKSALFVSNYKLRTPTKVGIGSSVFIGKSGFLTGDIEWVNFGSSRLQSSDFSTSADNAVIKDIYESVMNIRVGGEYRIDNFMLRAGYAILPSPYKNSSFEEQTNITFGVGYRTLDYFLDVAVVNSNRSMNYIPYEINANQPIVSSDIRNTAVTVTFGLNF